MPSAQDHTRYIRRTHFCGNKISFCIYILPTYRLQIDRYVGSQNIHPRLILSIYNRGRSILDLPIMQPINELLQQGKHNPARHEDDHCPQPVAVEGAVIALKILRAVHQPANGKHDPHGDSDAALARALAVELHPRVVDGVVPDGEGVDHGPHRPALPHPDSRVFLHLPRRDQGHQVAGLRGDDGGAPQPCPVAQPREEEHHGKGRGGAHGGEGVGGHAAEAQG